MKISEKIKVFRDCSEVKVGKRIRIARDCGVCIFNMFGLGIMLVGRR
jgi:hypothetical protein